MSGQNRRSHKTPLEKETSSGGGRLTPKDATTIEGGMGTAREELGTARGMLPEEQSGEGDRGMRAIYPILSDEELQSTPGTPQAAMEVPPAEAARYAPLFSERAYDEPGPVGPGPEAPKPGEAKPTDPEMMKLLVSDEDVKDLWERAGTVKTEVEEHVGTLPMARELLDLIQGARNELMAGRCNYEEAERFVNEVEYRVHLSVLMKGWSKTVGIRLFFYELAWAVLLIVLALVTLSKGYSSGQSETLYFFTSMVWGGFGGVVGAWFALVKHVAQDQDFDIQHTLWYLYTPPVGMAIGFVVWGLSRIGVYAVSGSATMQTPIAIYILAWLSGYQHNVFTDLVKRALKIFETPATPSPGQTTPAIPRPNKQNGKGDC